MLYLHITPTDNRSVYITYRYYLHISPTDTISAYITYWCYICIYHLLMIYLHISPTETISAYITYWYYICICHLPILYLLHIWSCFQHHLWPSAVCLLWYVQEQRNSPSVSSFMLHQTNRAREITTYYCILNIRVVKHNFNKITACVVFSYVETLSKKRCYWSGGLANGSGLIG